MSASEPRHVFCIGLGGVGVSAVARLLLATGVKVSGSDPQENPLVRDVVAHGGVYYSDESVNHLKADADLVVYTDDAGPHHPLRQRAAELNIAAENFSVTLGRFFDRHRTRIAIAGTNGKSTTTAMTGLLLTQAGLDPTVVVGSRVTEFDGNVRLGASQTMVIEADEYRDHYANYRPTIAVITNIEPDHLDYFGSVAAMEQSFRRFIDQLAPEGTLIVNADDPTLQRLTAAYPHVVTFGAAESATLRLTNRTTVTGSQTWSIAWRGQPLGNVTLPLPGLFNIMNAMAAMAAALTAGADSASFAKTLNNFHGIWRRFQILNPTGQTTIVSDYAHHPTAVQATITGAKQFFPGRRLIAVFQPHHRSRLTTLFDDFARCFSGADQVLLVETYTVPGRDIPESESKTTQQLVAQVETSGLPTIYAADVDAAEKQLRSMLQPGDAVLIMGAGDVWRMAERLAQHYV